MITVSGVVVNVDKSSRSGTLKKDKSDEMVKFRLANNMKKKDLPRSGDRVELTYQLDTIAVSSR